MAGPRTPEQRAREQIDAALAQAGWAVQDREDLNLGAARGVAVREFPMASGPADYLLFVDARPVGALEAKEVVNDREKLKKSGQLAGKSPVVAVQV